MAEHDRLTTTFPHGPEPYTVFGTHRWLHTDQLGSPTGPDGGPTRHDGAMTKDFAELPPAAAWRHRDARDGFEVVFLQQPADGSAGHWLVGQTTAVEAGVPWAVRYEITVDESWATKAALVWGWSASGSSHVRLDADGQGGWWVDGEPAPHLDGCRDVDLESSSCTNTFPVHRLRLEVGSEADAPAAYVRADDLRVERLEQQYTRVMDGDGGTGGHSYDYRAPVFDFSCRLVYDQTGLVLDYPGIAERVPVESLIV